MKTIKLREKDDLIYYATSITNQEYISIKEAYNNKTLEPLSTLYGINLNSINYLISAIKDRDIYISNKIIPYLDTFVCNTGGSKQLHYRDYTQPFEKQKKSAWLINICPDYKVCWQTVLLSLNKPAYCLIWSNLNTVNYDVREY